MYTCITRAPLPLILLPLSFTLRVLTYIPPQGTMTGMREGKNVFTDKQDASLTVGTEAGRLHIKSKWDTKDISKNMMGQF